MPVPLFPPIFIKDRDVFHSADWPKTQYEVHAAHELTVILLPLPSGITQFLGGLFVLFSFYCGFQLVGQDPFEG